MLALPWALWRRTIWPQAFFSSKAVADELVLLCLKSMIVADPALLAQLEAGEIAEEVH